MEELLRQLGLTDGEIKVYLALLPLGQSRVDTVMKATAVSSSKIYLILERLVQKGLVSKTTRNGVLHFEAGTPEKLMSYTGERLKELTTLQDELRKKITDLKTLQVGHQNFSAHMFEGWEGLKTFFISVLDELREGDEVRYFTISFDELTFKSTKTLLDNFSAKRKEKGVGMRVITDNPTTFKILRSTHTQMRLATFDTPDNTMIYGDDVAFMTFIDKPYVVLVHNARIAQSYAEYFDSVWKKIGK